jgi:hypothetical protein
MQSVGEAIHSFFQFRSQFGGQANALKTFGLRMMPWVGTVAKCVLDKVLETILPF